MSRILSPIQQLAMQDDVRHALEQIPRDVTPARVPGGKRFLVTEEELAQGLRKKAENPEQSLRGIVARVRLLELEVRKLKGQRSGGRKGKKS